MNWYILASVVMWVLGMLVLFVGMGRHVAKTQEKDTFAMVMIVIFWPLVAAFAMVAWPFWKAYQIGKNAK